MKRYSIILVLSLLFFSGYRSSFACSCLHWVSNFCSNLNEGTNNNTYLIKVVDLVYDYTEPHSRDYIVAKVLDEIDNDLTADTIQVFITNISGCTTYFNALPSDTILISLYTYENPDTNVFDLSACGVYYVPVKNDTLQWETLDNLDQLAYTDFKNYYSECEIIPERFRSSGKIVDWVDFNPIPNFTLEVINKMVSTDDTGVYRARVQRSVIRNSEYEVFISKEAETLQGVSTLDLIQINKFILGIKPLNAYQLIAADVDNSQSITTLDALYIKKVILGLSNTFPNSRNWHFIKRKRTFQDPINPWPELEGITDPIPLNYRDIDDHEHPVEIVAIKMGDVNGSCFTN